VVVLCLLPSGSKDELVRLHSQEGINEMFDQITVDPRLETFEQREREKRSRSGRPAACVAMHLPEVTYVFDARLS
jgi:hypothetical protein